MKAPKLYFLILFSFLWICSGSSQVADSTQLEVDKIIVSATRIDDKLSSLPYSLEKIQLDSSQFFLQKNSLQELLSESSGLFNQNATNYAQDLRISIRGFGARSAFGIRGIKLIVDGVPESTPDGQGQIDNLDLNGIQSIEILKGPSSGLYGNASGGVINISTIDEIKKDFIKLRAVLGSYSTQNLNLQLGQSFKSSSLYVGANFFNTDGYRNHSESQTFSFNSKFITKLGNKTKLRFMAGYTDSPKANDPGGINSEDVIANREQARQRNVDFNSGEDIQHFKSSINLKTKVAHLDFESNAFYHNRKFNGRLPFENGGMIDLSRQFIGHSSNLLLKNEGTSYLNKSRIGYDIQFQKDDRIRFVNQMGVQGPVTLDQQENFNNYALYFIDQLKLNTHYNFHFNLRYDRIAIDLNDGFLSDGDNSSSLDYNSLNYSAGLIYTKDKTLSPFFRMASSFETPTLSELSANPESGGFNKNLKPINSQNYEFGVKSKISASVNWTTSIFFINSSNEILAFELEDFPGRDFFRNAGQTNRTGLEFSLDYDSKRKISGYINYTWSYFKFKDYIVENVNFENNYLPGIPLQSALVSINYRASNKLQFQSQNQIVGKLFANDSNSIVVDRYVKSDIKASCLIGSKKYKGLLFMGINNLLNTNYFDNIRINAFGSRHYEVAPNRNYYLGFQLTI